MGLERMYYDYAAQKIKGVVQHSYRLCSRNANPRGRSGRKNQRQDSGGNVTSFSAVEFLGAMLMSVSTYGAVKEAKTALIAGESVNVNGLTVTLKDLYARRPGSQAGDGFAD